MFFNGKKYNVRKATEVQQRAFMQLLNHQATRFFLLDAERTLQSVQFLVSQLVPEFDQELTEANKNQVFRMIRKWQKDPERAAIITERDERRWESEHV